MDSRLDNEDVSSLLERFEAAIDDLVCKGMERDTILRQSMLTPQCGLGGLDEDYCLKAMHLLNSLSWTIREKYHLG